jgi:hypothetical protein
MRQKPTIILSDAGPIDVSETLADTMTRNAQRTVASHDNDTRATIKDNAHLEQPEVSVH